MVSLANLIALVLGATSSYALANSYSSIPKLQKYEEKTKKAAEWSTTAENRLWGTRKTVGAGFVTTIVSILTAIKFAFFVGASARWTDCVIAAALSWGVWFVARYMRDFWDSKAEIPFLDDYNAAIKDTINVMGLLDVLSLGWGLLAGLKLVGY